MTSSLALSLRAAPMRATFRIRALADAQVPLRILGQFARLDMLPARIIVEQSADWLTTTVVLSDIDEPQARIIAAKIGSIVLVEDVTLEVG